MKKTDTVTKPKRYDGEGTIRVRDDGRWEYRISLGAVDGKYKYKSFYAASEKEIKKIIKEYQADRKKYMLESDRTPLAVYAKKWMQLYKFPNIRDSSKDRLESTYINHIEPRLGSVPVSQITSDDLQKLINDKAQELSLSYVKKIYQFLNGLFGYLMCNQIVILKARDKDGNPGKRQRRICETKTAAGRRIIPLNDKAIEALRQIQFYNKQMRIDTPYVISTETGERITDRSLLRSLDYALGAIGAHHIGLHGLRHTFASRMLMMGTDITVVSKLLGHKDIAVTYNTYIHVLEAQKQQAMRMIPAI